MIYKKLFKLLSSVLLLISVPSYGELKIGQQGFDAPISGFTKTTVKVLHKGKFWYIPRGKIANSKNLKIGEMAQVVLNKDDFDKIKIITPPAIKEKKPAK